MSAAARIGDRSAEGLAALEARVRKDLAMIDPGPSGWVRPRVGPDGARALDVAIVGAGQSGLGAAFALLRERVSNILVLDENEPGFEGPWVTYARMITLRTPKHLTSIEGGVPSLTFRAWYEAQHGEAAWAALDKIPRGDWMDYLRWFRRVLDLPVRNGSKVTRIEPAAEGLFRLDIAGQSPLFARKVVLATGIQGGGEWHTPGFISRGLDPSRYAHTSQAIDFAALKGRRIGILGGGASAFDNAQHALAQGAGAVHVFIRRPSLPTVNPIRQMEGSGMIRHFAALDDAGKYAALDHFLRLNQPPTNDTYLRAKAFPNFHLHLGAPWDAVAEVGDAVRVRTPKGDFDLDFLILSTGLVTDVALRPELAGLADDIAVWADRYRPPEGRANPLIEKHPYLGPAFEFTPKSEEAASRVHGLFAFNYAALASLGLSAAALSGLKVALPKLAAGVAAQLFLDDREAMLGDYFAYAEPEFTGQ